jgi:hypothetical protein
LERCTLQESMGPAAARHRGAAAACSGPCHALQPRRATRRAARDGSSRAAAGVRPTGDANGKARQAQRKKGREKAAEKGPPARARAPRRRSRGAMQRGAPSLHLRTVTVCACSLSASWSACARTKALSLALTPSGRFTWVPSAAMGTGLPCCLTKSTIADSHWPSVCVSVGDGVRATGVGYEGGCVRGRGVPVMLGAA